MIKTVCGRAVHKKTPMTMTMMLMMTMTTMTPTTHDGQIMIAIGSLLNEPKMVSVSVCACVCVYFVCVQCAKY